MSDGFFSNIRAFWPGPLQAPSRLSPYTFIGRNRESRFVGMHTDSCPHHDQLHSGGGGPAGHTTMDFGNNRRCRPLDESSTELNRDEKCSFIQEVELTIGSHDAATSDLLRGWTSSLIITSLSLHNFHNTRVYV
jgi:hypothetical protein